MAFELRYAALSKLEGGWKRKRNRSGRMWIQEKANFAKQVERYTAAIPSSSYLAVAVAAMAASPVFQIAGRGKWGNFLAQWVPTWLIIGLYNKMVKLEGHDFAGRPNDSGSVH